MGWLFSTTSLARQKEEILEDLRKEGYEFDYKTTNYGRHFWVKLNYDPHGGADRENQRSIIVLYLFHKEGGEWGYKDMDEHCHPYYYDCPLSFIQDHNGTSLQAKQWREKVKEYHRGRANKRNGLSPIENSLG